MDGARLDTLAQRKLIWADTVPCYTGALLLSQILGRSRLVSHPLSLRANSSVEEQFQKSQLREAVLELLQTLPVKFRGVLRAHFGIDHTELSIEEIARVNAVPWELVRARLGLALRKCQHPARRKLLHRAKSLSENVG
jgi:DNA-directed RNA polymerase specialized sigma24 family protein